MFNASKGEYEQVLKRSGYSNISLSCQQSGTSHVKRQRHRNIICSYPPYSPAVITNVSKKYLQFLDLHFPPLNKFHKIFTWNNVKLNTHKSHNKKLINSSNHHAHQCNCRKKEYCPLEGKCRTEYIIHECLILRSEHPDKAYLGTAEGNFTKRYYNYISSFKNEARMNKTTLAKFVCELKQKYNVTPTLKWNIFKYVPTILR